ncbi:MAG: hypothetical protein ACTSUX_09490 [Promethearchaeota archaeon]
MERQREKPKEKVKVRVEEQEEKDIETLKRELQKLKELKKQREQQETSEMQQEDTASDIESRLDKIEDFLTKDMAEVGEKQYLTEAKEIENELAKLELEIAGEHGVIAKEISTYELLLNEYPWLEEKRYIFMYSIPNKKKNLRDFESWKNEWAKVLFDYARFAILHILYLRKLQTIKPFSKFDDREKALKIIAQTLVEKKQAEWLSKSKEKLRVYWKSLDNWAEEIYEWAKEISPLEPILIFEIRESDRDFKDLPEEDLIKIFKILEKSRKGKIIKLDDGQISFKIKVE